LPPLRAQPVSGRVCVSDLEEDGRQSSVSLDKKTLLDSLDARARLSFFRSEYVNAEQMFRKQIELASELSDAFEFVKANYFLGLTLANLG
jgi:hypothetical protein